MMAAAADWGSWAPATAELAAGAPPGVAGPAGAGETAAALTAEAGAGAEAAAGAGAAAAGPVDPISRCAHMISSNRRGEVAPVRSLMRSLTVEAR